MFMCISFLFNTYKLIFTHLHTSSHTHAHAHTHIHTHIHTHTHTHTHTHIYTHTQTLTHTHTHTHTYTNIHTHSYTHAHANIIIIIIIKSFYSNEKETLAKKMTFKMPPAWPIKTKQFTVQTSITQTLHIVEIIKNSTLKNWKRCNITYKTRQIVPLIDCSIFKKTKIIIDTLAHTQTHTLAHTFAYTYICVLVRVYVCVCV